MNKGELAFCDLIDRNLTRDENDRNLRPYIKDRELSVKLFGTPKNHGTVYRARQLVELKRLGIDIEKPIIYFFLLPTGLLGVIKVGVTILGRLDIRIESAHTYYVSDVELLGFIRTSSMSNARKKESKLLDTFGRANTSRHQCELVWDTPAIRRHIKENCESPISYIKAVRTSRFHNHLFQNG